MEDQFRELKKVYIHNGYRFELILVDFGHWELRMPVAVHDMLIADELSQNYKINVERVERCKSSTLSVITFTSRLWDGAICREVAETLESVFRTA